MTVTEFNPKPEGSARPAHICEAEWEARVDLAACYRIFDHLGWIELIYSHITQRVPEEKSGERPAFLINGFGLMHSEVTASNLLKVDLDGDIIGDSKWELNPAGYVIHSAIHGAINQAHCIMHTHTTTGIAVSCKQDGLDWNNFYSAMMYGQVAYHDFEGITVNKGERERMIESLGDKRTMILRNHGLLSWGENISEAFVRLWTLQRACDVQVMAEGIAGKSIELSDEVRANSVEAAQKFYPEHQSGRRVFDALKRIIHAKDPSYAT
ncbi:MAG: class II aldolase/adducin family protein [Alphaproteobacteria bacterium]|nr:class II aldolase/adducin family protein [Alphaproteobacteria bacterium]